MTSGLKNIIWHSILVAVCLFSLFLTYMRNEVWGSSMSLWRDAMIKSPMKARPHSNVGVELLAKGKVEDAERQFIEALRLKPYHPIASLNLAMIYSKRGDLDGAIAIYEKSLTKYQDHAPLLLEYGIALETKGDYLNAEEAYKKALEIDPDFLTAAIRLGGLYRKTGRFDEMLILLKETYRKNPKIVEIQPELKRILAEQPSSGR